MKLAMFLSVFLLASVFFACDDEDAMVIVDDTIGTRAVSSKLYSLQVRSYCTSPAYNRSLYTHWIDANGDCENTRTEVLKRDTLASMSGSCNSMSGGQWKCPYYCTTHYDKSEIDIDHFVPLSNAHKTGGCNWSSTKRKNFANDLGYYWSLRATSASANRSKGSKDPGNWLPRSSCMSACYYSNVWINVKYRWGLWVTSSEKASLEANCQ